MATTVSQISTSKSSNAGTPFVWAKLVQGKKMNLAESQAEEAAKAQLAKQVRLEKETKETEECKDRFLKEQLKKEKREHEFEQAKAAQKIHDAEIDAKYSVENGYWHNEEKYKEYVDFMSYRDVPRSVNKHALDFAQKFLTYNGAKAAKCTTLFELEEVFYDAYAPYALMNYQRSANDFIKWEKTTFPLGADVKKYENIARYTHLQQWMTQEKVEWESKPKSHQYLNCAPWSLYPIWIFLSNVNWLTFLKAIDEKSGAFETGIIKIEGNPLNMASPITWQVSLEPYLCTRFHEKAPCAAKKKRQDEDWEDSMLD